MTNKEFAEKDEPFNEACKKANVFASAKQASKFRIGKGIAVKVLLDRAEPLKKGHPGYWKP